MLRGYRSIFVAFGGLVLAAASPPGQPGQRDQTQTNANVEQSLRDIVAALHDANEPDETTKPCPKKQDDRNSDLCAQWKAADAAAESADWTRRTFWLSVGGLVVGILTLGAAGAAAKFAHDAAVHTQAGANEAKRSADYAERTLVHSQQVGAIQLRPWMVCTGPQVTEFSDGHIDSVFEKSGLILVLKFKNAGNTPAMKASLWFNVIVGPWGGDCPEGITRKRGKEKPAIIAPSMTATSSQSALGEADTAAYLNNTAEIWMYGELAYGDFNDPSANYSTAVTLRMQFGGFGKKEGGEKFLIHNILAEGTQRMT